MTSDVYSPEKRSAVMRRVKGKDTAPERVVRRLVWGLGGRYRLHRADLPGKPDIVLPGRRLAIFVHGCFWHGHDCARGARVPKANRDYWVGKIARNRSRDATHRAALEVAGWRVETIWECELKDRAALEARVRELLSSPAGGGVCEADGGGTLPRAGDGEDGAANRDSQGERRTPSVRPLRGLPPPPAGEDC